MDNAYGKSGPIRSDFADDPDMIELVEEFVGYLPTRVESLRTSLENGDAESVARLAHQLSGACGGYGFGPIGDVARALESRVRELDNAGGLSALHDQVDELVQLCARVVV